MATRNERAETVSPSLEPGKAIELIRRQIERGEELRIVHYSSSAKLAWISTTETILDRTFGKPNGQSDRRTVEFLNAHGGSVQMGNSASLQRAHQISIDRKIALLKAYAEQLDDVLAPANATEIDKYRFHSAIEAVSGDLLRDGHHKSAALEAYIRVIHEVKIRAGIPELDGDRLMNRAFGSEGQAPILAFNTLQTESERDEQKGIMLLFKGIVGLRNSKAHDNRLFDSSERAHEYLALASLLMRLLEIAIRA